MLNNYYDFYVNLYLHKQHFLKCQFLLFCTFYYILFKNIFPTQILLWAKILSAIIQWRQKDHSLRHTWGAQNTFSKYTYEIIYACLFFLWKFTTFIKWFSSFIYWSMYTLFKQKDLKTENIKIIYHSRIITWNISSCQWGMHYS